jgi:choline dehydrogenase-like flavoprotein
VTLLRPKSRGSVRLASADPDAPIELDGGVLRHQDDVDALVRGVEVVRRMLKASSLAKICSGEVYSDPSGGDSALAPELFVRKYVRPISHVSCTCRMGSDDSAVVDPELRVKGVKRLRVADASVMPRVTSGNTNSVAILIGEKCARSVLHSLN